MNSVLGWLTGGLGIIFFLLFALVQAAIGFMGIEYHLGYGWAIGFLIAAFVLRFTLPLTIGTFFGALNVLDWPLIGAILITLPGLIFMIPGAIAIGIAGLSSLFKEKNQNQYQQNFNTQEENNYAYNNNEIKDVTPEKKNTKIAKKITYKKTKKIIKKKKKSK